MFENLIELGIEKVLSWWIILFLSVMLVASHLHSLLVAGDDFFSLVKVLDDLEVFFFDRGQRLYLILAIFFGRFIDRLFMAYFSRIGEKLPAAG